MRFGKWYLDWSPRFWHVLAVLSYEGIGRKNEATANEYSHPLMWSTHKKQWFNIFGIVSGALKKGDGISKMYLPHLFTGFWEETSFNSLAKKKTLSNSENNFRRGPCCNIGGLRKNPYSRTFRSTPIYKRGGHMLLNVFMYIHTGSNSRRSNHLSGWSPSSASYPNQASTELCGEQKLANMASQNNPGEDGKQPLS